MEKKEIHKLDAAGIPLGRLASQAAKILMGKHKSSYLPNIDSGYFVVVENFGKVKFTGRKMEQKLYYKSTKQPGKLKSETLSHLISRRPYEVLRRAVFGMLPKNSLRKSMIKRLTIEN